MDRGGGQSLVCHLTSHCMAWTGGCLEPIMPKDYASSRASLPEHPPQIIREGFRFLVGCKVPTGIVFRLEHDI